MCNSDVSCAEDFALSIHSGVTSADPVLATVWGANVARASVEDRCFDSNGTVPTATNNTVSTSDTSGGSDTVLVGLEGFYVRLRGLLNIEDAVVFECWSELLPPDPLTSILLYFVSYK